MFFDSLEKEIYWIFDNSLETNDHTTQLQMYITYTLAFL